MELSMLSGPIIGAVIGYCTNYIAIKMLFRPLKPVKIGKLTLPFTPGIIPKEKKRMARAIGEVVGNKLLTQESLQAVLLTQEMKEKVQSSVEAFWSKQKEDETTVKEKALQFVEEEKYQSIIESAQNTVTDKILEKLEEMNVGEIIAKEGIKTIKQKLGNSFLTMMVKDSFMESMSAPIAEAMNEYIRNNGQVLIYAKVSEETDKISNLPMKDMAKAIEIIDIVELSMKSYERLVKDEFGHIIKGLNISKIIEEKIDEMEVLELEELLMSIMKKELNAVINLGALLGFLLGMINLLF